MPASKTKGMTSHPTYGAVPPDNQGTGTVIVSTPDATATYSSSGTLTVKSKKYSSNVTVSGTGITSGSGMTYTTGTGVSPTWSVSNEARLTSGKLNIVGDDADVVINGKSLTDTLQALEERLNILVPNSELETEWDELKTLGDRYRKLEKELVEKSRMWQALQKTS